MESCNCDYLCPCIYTNPQGPATEDKCTALMVFRIDNGSSAATRLDGLKFALVIRSGRVMADGNWIFGVIVDEAADPVQRQVLSGIASGEAGGPPGLIRQNLVGDFRGVTFAPIEFAMAGLTRRAAVPQVMSFEIEGVASRNSSGDPYYIDNTGHPANRRLGLSAGEGNACARIRPRFGPIEPGQQRSFRSVRMVRLKAILASGDPFRQRRSDQSRRS
jgi:hypothetical protein